MKSLVTHFIAVLREPLPRLILLIDANLLLPDFPVQFALAVQEAKRLQASTDRMPPPQNRHTHLMGERSDRPSFW